MKIAINTITDGANYGNRLQNYALQKVLQDEGHNVVTLRHITSNDLNGMKRVAFWAKNTLKRILGRPYAKKRRLYRHRVKRFDEFSKIIFQSKEQLHHNMTSSKLNAIYDMFVCGSDQVWNARISIIKEDLLNYLCAFASPEKRVAYAASFGTNDIPAEYVPLFCRELSKFKAISVRESGGVQLLKKYGIESRMVVDPTMLLGPSEWLKLARRPNYCDENKYILTYFLGGISKSMRLYIEELKKKGGYCVIDLQNEFQDDENIENSGFYLTDPAEFLWMVANSEIFLTDSYHGAVFSILFKKPFFVFERRHTETENDMSGRIQTLLQIFRLTERLKNIDAPSGIPMPVEPNYIDGRLKELREEALQYLRNALKP